MWCLSKTAAAEAAGRDAQSIVARDGRLSTLAAAMSLGPVPIDDRVASWSAGLGVVPRDQGLRMPVNDSWVAATAMALHAATVTQNDDLPLLNELEVIRVRRSICPRRLGATDVGGGDAAELR